MAKAKIKKTNRSYKTGKKNKSLLPDLTKHFNLSSPRGRLLSFMLAFAFVGSGFMAYQAFASTSNTGWGGRDMAAFRGTGTKSPSRGTETTGNKKGAHYVTLHNGNFAFGTPARTSRSLQMRPCVFVRSIGISTSVRISVRQSSGALVGGSNVNVPNSADYRMQCAGWSNNPPNVNATVHIQHRGSAASQIRISSLIMEYR